MAVTMPESGCVRRSRKNQFAFLVRPEAGGVDAEPVRRAMQRFGQLQFEQLGGIAAPDGVTVAVGSTEVISLL